MNKDKPPSGSYFRAEGNKNHIVVDVPLDWPLIKDDIVPYTPPPEDYEKVVEASLGIPISKLGQLAQMEVCRIYLEGLCGGARGNAKKAMRFNNWVSYVVKCLWTAYNNGLLRGCRSPKTVLVK